MARTKIDASLVTPIRGTATNDSAGTGNIGEYVSSSVFNQAVGTAGQYSDVTSVSLTAGDWDVTGILAIVRTGATFTSVTAFGGISTTSGNSSTGLTTGDTLVYLSYGSDTSFLGASGTIGALRISLTTTTTVYLKGYVDGYTIGTPKHYGRISARRVR